MNGETLRPERGSFLYWSTIFQAHDDVDVLRDRQATKQLQRERFRCGGCSGYATHVQPDSDPETGEELCGVPLCDTCTIDDATPRTVWDWSDEHKAARPPELPDWGEPFTRSSKPPHQVAPKGQPAILFMFTIQRNLWLRGQGDGEWQLVDDSGTRWCAVAYYLRVKGFEQPKTSYRVGTLKRLQSVYESLSGLHHISTINERTDISDQERETQLRDAFRAIGIVVAFAEEGPVSK